MQHNIALCKIILHTSPAESPIFRSESTSFKRQPSPSETFADYSQNHKQIQPFMGFAKKSASNRSCRNAPTRTTPRGKRSFGRYAQEAGQPLRGDRRARRSPRRGCPASCAYLPKDRLPRGVVLVGAFRQDRFDADFFANPINGCICLWFCE